MEKLPTEGYICTIERFVIWMAGMQYYCKNETGQAGHLIYISKLILHQYWDMS